MSLKPLVALAALLAAVPLPAQTPIAPGQTVTGRLQEGDARMEGSYYDAYVIRGPRQAAVLVTMHSDDLDAYLVSGRESGGAWEEHSSNDDAGGSTDARMIAFLGEDGTVQVRAAAASDDEVGGYTLRVTLMGEPDAVPVRAGQTVRGRLERTDHEGVTGFEDHYAIQAAPDDTITIHVESDEFDPAVAVGGAHGGLVSFEAYDDDGGPGTNAALVVRVGGPEPYHLVVHAFDPGSTGAYTLRLAPGADVEGMDWDSKPDSTWADTDTAVVVMDSAAEWTDTTIIMAVDTVAWTPADSLFTDSAAVPYMPFTVTAGEPVAGVLGESPPDEDGRYFEHFIYTARTGERLRISLTSESVDPLVAIGTGTFCSFDALAQDDDGGRGWNAELEWTAPESGEYVIRVTTAAPGEAGTFVLRVHSIP